jgi:glutathione synthase/RimK-type ligase-like ATP-grasp enzyme
VKTVALATSEKWPQLSPDDGDLSAALRGLGIDAAPVVWSDASVDWSKFAAVIVRSCWDYHLRPAAFHERIDGVERMGVAVWNPPETIRWNADKSYLRDLAARGVPTVPTAWVEQGDPTSLHDVLWTNGWDRAVVKPAVSASAHETWTTDRAQSAHDESRFHALTARTRTLVQPFVESIVETGEWSLVFIDGAYSHAVLKRPRTGDFRVQEEHGGSAQVLEPGGEVIAAAHDVLAAAGSMGTGSLYARVDGCIVRDVFVLMELELIEPALYLGTSRAAADRLADAVLERLRRS